MNMSETTIELRPLSHCGGIIKSIYKMAQHQQQQQLLRTANSLISIDTKGNYFKEIIFKSYLTTRVWPVFKVLAFVFMRHRRDSGVSSFQATTYREYLQVAHFSTQISFGN